MIEQIPEAARAAVQELLAALEAYDLAEIVPPGATTAEIRRCGEAEARVRELFGIPWRSPRLALQDMAPKTQKPPR